MEHTEGPWRACGGASVCECRQIWAPGRDVMVATAVMDKDTDGMGVVSREEAQANAALIAKAPTMKLALEAIAGMEPSEDFDFQAIATMMRVIAKVELADSFDGMIAPINAAIEKAQS